MTIYQQIELFDQLTEKAKSILLSKGNDYANEDRLSNFKLAGNICGITPEQQCLSLIATKVSRLGNLLKGKEPNNESIQDSMVDMFCYSALLWMINNEPVTNCNGLKS